MTSSAKKLIPYSQFEQLRSGREIIRSEADALLNLARNLDASFLAAVELIAGCSGSVIVCGMGKAGLIGKKLAATFSSTGTRSHFLHPAEALHGDMGCLHPNDILLALSNSGETEEVLAVVPQAQRIGMQVVAMTGSEQNSLARCSDVVLPMGRIREACRWGLAPSTSTTVMLGLGDALALVVSEVNGFQPHHFAQYHPGGSLGQRLKPVTEIMRPRHELRIASDQDSVRHVIASTSRPGRRIGAVLLVDESDRLSGIFTDSDLARLLETRRDSVFDAPVAEVMTVNPVSIRSDALFTEVVDLLSDRKISEIPVIDQQQIPVGLIDITDVIGWLPKDSSSQSDRSGG